MQLRIVHIGVITNLLSTHCRETASAKERNLAPRQALSHADKRQQGSLSALICAQPSLTAVACIGLVWYVAALTKLRFDSKAAA